MNLPGRIFSIGGAGKQVAFELLESEWVLREVLRPRPNPQSVTVTVMDTAEEEENRDLQRIRKIRDNIAELKEELRSVDAGRVGEVTVEYKSITQNIQLNDQNDLIGEATVPRITEGNGIKKKHWWVDEQHINENLDFATGVVRKRGLGKGIYYKAYAEDDELSTYIDLPKKGKVAIIAGLGGGTGSGIAIDVARHLQQKQRTAEITLFGVLPNHTEGIRESANAYAMLSELEYLSLSGNEVFKDMILLPIDPTGFDGKGGNKIQNTRLLKELDEAIVYLMAAYYNTIGSEDPFTDSPTYAPFTIGVPQVLRYNVEAINEAKEALREILNAKEEAVQAELEIYTQLERFLEEQYGEPTGDGLRELDRANLEERVDDIRSLLSFDLFNELEYESVSIFEDIITDAEAESEAIAEQIDIISGSLRAIDTTGKQAGRFVDNIDEHLAEVLEADLQSIGQRKRLLVKKQSIDNNRVRDAIEYLINSDDGSGNPGVKLTRLESQLEEITKKRSRLEAERKDTIEELEEIQKTQEEEIQRKVRDWNREAKPLVEQINQIDIDSIEKKLSALEQSIERFKADIVNADSEDEIEHATTQEITRLLNELESELEQVGLDGGIRRTDIEASLSGLKQCRKAVLTLNAEEGTLEKLTPWSGKTEKQKDEAHRNFRVQKNRLEDSGIFSVGPPSGNFSVTLEYDEGSLLRELEQRKREIENELIDTLAVRIETFEADFRREFESEIQHGPQIDQLRETARRALESEIVGVNDLQEQKTETEAKIETVETTIDTYESTITLFKNLNQRREIYARNLSEFHRELSEYDQESSRSVTTEREESAYVTNIKPSDVFRATGEDDIAQSDLFKSREETQRVHSALEDLVENVFNEQYSGIKKRSFSKGRQRYDDIRIRVGVTSRAVNQIDPDAIDFENRFNNAFDLGASGNRVKNPYTSWQHNVGDSWDIGLSVFIDGIFLDNLRKMVQPDGYRSGYQKRENDLGEDILIHHNYGLDQGFYVRRESLLNMEIDEDVGFFLQDETKIVDHLLSEHIDCVDLISEGDTMTSEQTERNELGLDPSKTNASSEESAELSYDEGPK